MVQLLVVGGKSLEDSEAAREVWFREELGYVSVAIRHFKELFVTKRKALSSFLVFLLLCSYLPRRFCGIMTLLQCWL